MKFDSDVYRRRSIRLSGFDYAQEGSYFVTICCHERRPLFGEVVNGEMRLNAAGRVVADCKEWLSTAYAQVNLNEFVTMPNHVHAIIEIVGADPGPSVSESNRAPTVGMLVRAFKARCSRAINALWQSSGKPVWQRNYYEHIIRNEESYRKIAEYIETNPQRWTDDIYHV